MVYDQSVQLPGCAWTDRHSAQGFARRNSTVNFGTPLEFGYADVTVSLVSYKPSKEYHRVIAVPFLITSGKVIVDGPEETNVRRSVELPPGNYRLVAAQRITGDAEEIVDLFFEPLANPLERSSVLVADGAIDQSVPPLETAGIAGNGD